MFPAPDLTRRRLAAALAAILLIGLLPATVLAAAPSASPQSVSTFENISIPIVLTGTDPDGDPLTFSIAAFPSTGALSGITNVTCDSNTPSSCSATMTYTPAADSNGPDGFTYAVDDGALSDSATIDISVHAVNHAPAGADKTVTTFEDTPYTFGATDFGFSDPTDSPPNALLAVKIATVPAAGVLKDNGSTVTAGVEIPLADITGNQLVFTPGAGGVGAAYATFTFQVRDDGGTTNGGVDLDQSPNTITVDVGGVNHAPRARNDVGLTVPESAGATSLPVTANDTDVDGDTLRIINKTNGAHGAVAIAGGGSGLTYDPVQGFYGTDGFTYTISDGHGLSSTATVVLTVVKDTVKPVTTAPAQTFYNQTSGTSSVKVKVAWAGRDTGGTGVANYKLQVSVNGHAYTTITSSTTATSTTRTLSINSTYRFRVRATDKQGNVGFYAYGPTFKPVRYQNTSTAVHYVGRWTTSSSASALGGSHRYTSAVGASVSFTGSLRNVAWIATRTTSSGSAQVWIDGTLSATINLRSSRTLYKQLVYHRDFGATGTHTIEIRSLGGGRVYFDALTVIR